MHGAAAAFPGVWGGALASPGDPPSDDRGTANGSFAARGFPKSPSGPSGKPPLRKSPWDGAPSLCPPTSPLSPLSSSFLSPPDPPSSFLTQENKHRNRTLVWWWLEVGGEEAGRVR